MPQYIIVYMHDNAMICHTLVYDSPSYYYLLLLFISSIADIMKHTDICLISGPLSTGNC